MESEKKRKDYKDLSVISATAVHFEEMAHLDEVLVAKVKLLAEKRALNSNLQTLKRGGRRR